MEKQNQVASKRILEKDSFGSSSGRNSRAVPPMSMAGELHEEEHWPVSGKPFFHVVLSKSYLQNSYQLILPVKIHSVIPCSTFATSVTYRGLEWNMVCDTTCKVKRFHSGWDKFVADNDIGVGDACVFELLELSGEMLKFRAQILRNHIPSVILRKMNGDSTASANVPN